MSSGLSLLNYSHLSTKSSHAPIQSNYALPTSTLPDYISSRLFPVTPKPMYSQPTARRLFTQRELDMVLYGYTPDRSIFGACPVRHALSGVFSTTGVSRLSPNTCHISSQPMKQEECFPSTLDLPRGLGIFHSSTVNHKGVFCTEAVISKGTKFGPFKGRVVHMSEVKAFDDNSHMWEVFNQRGSLSHFVDGKGAAGGWMTYVNCARYPTEQNMVVHQVGQDIYYEACKDITPGMELLVWYGDAYQQFIGIPLTMKENSSTAGNVGEEKTTDACQDGYQCDRCGKMFAYAYYRDKHLKYTRCVDKGDRKFKCHLCDRSFEKRDRLRIHILHVHEKHRPHKCTVCDKCFSQSSSLNKHMRVHSGERPYKCVYCSKAFTASSILRTHIRQHSGEKPFKCKHCGKAFASHAAHDSHVRRTHNKNTVFGKEILNNKVMPVTQPLSPSVKSEGSSSGYSDTISECAEDMHIDVVA